MVGDGGGREVEVNGWVSGWGGVGLDVLIGGMLPGYRRDWSTNPLELTTVFSTLW